MQNEEPSLSSDPSLPNSIVGHSQPGLPPEKSKFKKRLLAAAALLILVIAIIAIAMLMGHKTTQPVQSSFKKSSAKAISSQTTKVAGLNLDTSKNYGDKYANGILPVGDGKYSTTTPKVGYVYACNQYAQSLSSSQGGASSRGPWFTDNNTEYDLNKKIHVEGSVMWQAVFSNQISGGYRIISTNDLPSQPTGIFPIATSDPAYLYDRNPNSIKGQSLVYKLPLNPTYGQPQCMGGESGIMLSGVALFNGFDAGGRDAGAWEIQDSCDGHPQSDGIYHYHTLSSCIKNTNVSTVIGYALDGYPITGPEIAPNDYLTTADLDVCHGIVSQISLDGKEVTMYHYVMTEDFPYSISCFRSTPIEAPDLAANLHSQGQSGPGPNGRINPGGASKPL